MNVQKQVVSILSLSEFEKIGITSVSAVGLVGGFVLNRADSGFGLCSWLNHSDSAAHAKH